MLGKACLFLLLFPLLAQAGDECYRDLLVVDKTVVWDLSQPQKLDVQLPSWHRYQGSILTPAFGHFTWDGARTLNTDFDFATPRVGLPYNVYRMDVALEGGSEDSKDFTGDCTSPGLSFYPGAHIQLHPTLFPLAPAGEKVRVRVRIWGVLR